MAANIIGGRRILDIVKKYGVDMFHESVEEIMNYSEKMVQIEIDNMPDGCYEAEDYLENTGVSDDPVKIKVAITIQGKSLKIDYTGTDSQVDGPINAVWGVTLSGVYYTLKCVTDPTIPMNDGYLRSVEVYAPKGTILNPVPPAPVAGGNTETSQRNVDVLLKAFAKIIPKRVCAACQGTTNNVSVGGIDPKTGSQWSFYETIAGGFGGRYGIDGVDAIHTHMTNTMNTPIEAVEGIYPLRFLKYELRMDSGGPGKWRGGVGVERSWMMLASSATLSILAERTKIPPWGLYGGKPGSKGEYLIVKPDGKRIVLNSKCTLRIGMGDVLIVRTPGGGGYGDPLERDPNLVLKDVVNGLVSLDSAKNDYGVLIKPNTMEIDLEETQKLRKKMKTMRNN
jgi:N-methylhydantoinase B